VIDVDILFKKSQNGTSYMGIFLSSAENGEGYTNIQDVYKQDLNNWKLTLIIEQNFVFPTHAQYSMF